MAAPLVTAVVPTLGRSPLLGACLRAIRRAGGADVEIVVVDQATPPLALESPAASETPVDRVLRPSAAQRLGFAAANNFAFATSQAPFIATINDDATVGVSWFEHLLDALRSDPGLGAVQGNVLDMAAEPRIDGRGIAWNRWRQAIQLGRGRAPTDATADQEIFGASATAAIFRRSALDEISRDGLAPAGSWFEPRLGSYYEDVDLAYRLRACGWQARNVVAAAAHHAGSTTGNTLPQRSLPLIYGNRHLTLARLLGYVYWPRLPKILMRDMADLWQARRRGDHEAVTGIVKGLGRAVRLLPTFARARSPLVSTAELRRFTVDEA